MRTIDRIRQYIQERRNSGELLPGAKLPTYHELMLIGQGSYATVRTAMSKLEGEGLIEIRNGNGSFLAGGNTLRVRLNINSRAMSAAEMLPLLERHIAAAGLNITVDIHSTDELCDQSNYMAALRDELAILSIAETGTAIHLPQAQLDNFADFNELCAALHHIAGHSMAVSLPFASYTYQLGFSREILRNIGFAPERISGNVGAWWDDYAACCRRAGVNAASLFWPAGATGEFMRIYGLLFSLAGYDLGRYNGREKLFDSAAGHRLLRIVDDTLFYPSRPHRDSFFSGRAGVSFNIGSWMTRQNQTARRPDITVNEFDAVPFEYRGRRIYPASVDYLECYMRDDLPVEKRNRIWRFMQLLLSREFQLDFCNGSGMLSLRRDILPQEYTWNTDRGRNSFCPHPGDLVIFEDQVFSEQVCSALTILLEDYKIYRADAAAILKRMDDKKNVEATAMTTLNNRGE